MVTGRYGLIPPLSSSQQHRISLAVTVLWAQTLVKEGFLTGDAYGWE